MRKIRLHTKFVLILTSVALVPLAFLAPIMLARFQTALENDATKIGQQLAATAAAETRTFMVSEIRILENIAVLYHPQFPIDPSDAERILENILLSSQNFTDISVVHADGKEIARKNRLLVIRPEVLHGPESDARLEAVRESGVYVGPVYISGGRSFFDLGRQIVDLEGNFAGAVFAQVDARIMPTVVERISRGGSGRVYIVNEKGVVIAYPDFSYVLGARDLSALPAVLDAIQGKGAASSARYVNEIGQEVLGSAYPLTIELFDSRVSRGASISWFVVAEQPVEDVYQESNQAAIFALFALAAAVVFASGIAVYFAGRISKPIVSLHDAAAAFGKGDLRYRARVETGDEIGELADGFNNMATTIGATLDSLKEQEGIVSAERDKLGLILSGITNAVVAVDLERNVILFNAAAEALTGRATADVIGKPLETLFELFENDVLVPVDAFCPRTPGSGPIYSKNNLRMVGKGGERFVNIVSGKIHEGEEVRLGCILTLQDITKEYVVERNKREFVSIAAHQLRTPLTGMKWSVEYLLSGDRGALGDTQKSVVMQTKGAVDRMITLVNELLDVTRIDEGHLEVRPSVQSIAPVLSRVQAFFSEAAAKKGVAFKTQFDEDTPPVSIDAAKIEIVLNNLLDNALRYTASGGHIDFSVRSMGHILTIEVRDSGIGIAEKDRARIFTKFFRSGEALMHYTDGSGLGLYVAKNIIDRHGGTIAFTSEENVGTTFTITLPIA